MTTTQIEIDVLSAELEKKIADIEKYNHDIRKAMEENINYKSGTEIRKNEVAQLEKELESLKNSIPDFSEEICEKYLKYQEQKTYYENLVKDYQEIERRIIKSEENITLYNDCIAETKMRIEYLKKALEKTKNNLKED